MTDQTTDVGYNPFVAPNSPRPRKRCGIGDNSKSNPDRDEENVSLETISSHVAAAQEKVAEYGATIRVNGAEIEAKGVETLSAIYDDGTRARVVFRPRRATVSAPSYTCWSEHHDRHDLRVWPGSLSRIELVPFVLHQFRAIRMGGCLGDVARDVFAWQGMGVGPRPWGRICFGRSFAARCPTKLAISSTH